jgi:hypothetical protein
MPAGICIALGVCVDFYVLVMREGSATHVYAGIHGKCHNLVVWFTEGEVNRVTRYGNSIIMIVSRGNCESMMQLEIFDGTVQADMIRRGKSMVFACVDRLMVSIIDDAVYRSNNESGLRLEFAANASSFGKVVVVRAIERWVAIVNECDIARNIDGHDISEFWNRLVDTNRKFRDSLTTVVVSSFDQERGVHATFRGLIASRSTDDWCVLQPICDWIVMGGL